jgi:DNA-binding response OmpR family regulator
LNKARSFLVVADDPERLMLVSTTLHRKFPNAIVQTCRDSEAALAVARDHTLDAIVAQRSSDLDELPLVESLRAVTTVPIVLMSGPHHADGATDAGASLFLRHDQWLLIGTAVARLIGAEPVAS